MDELYRSETVLVRRIASDDQSRWVVTFDNYGIGPGFNRSGFGEAFFRSRGVSAIHVLGRSDDWYQYSDVFLALEAVREAISGSDRIMTYGSSMGGYAAIRFADLVEANAVLAMSPQYSIDPARQPFDARWQQDAHRIAWMPEIDGPVKCRCQPVVVFDPKSMDGNQVSRLSQDIRIVEIPLPYSGHPATTYLQEADLLEPLVMAVLHDTLDPEFTRTEARARRKTSMAYLNELTRIQPPWRKRMALGLARYASRLAPDDPNAMWALANQLVSTGAHDEALPLFERAIQTAGRLPTLLNSYANGLMAAGRFSEAFEIAREVLDLRPGKAHLLAWYAHVAWGAGHEAEARQAINSAIALDPTSDAYSVLAQAYEGAPSKDVPCPSEARAGWFRSGFRWARRQCQRSLTGRPRGRTASSP